MYTSTSITNSFLVCNSEQCRLRIFPLCLFRFSLALPSTCSFLKAKIQWYSLTKWKHLLHQFLLQSLICFIPSSFTTEPTPLIFIIVSHSFNLIYINSLVFSYMGAGISSIAAENDDGGSLSLSSEAGLGDIPEICISFLLMNFEPQEICKLARVNRAFYRASSADFVWESKLPPSYKFLVKKVFGEENLKTMTKKEIYAKLCQPNFFDGGTKEVWLDRRSGQVCLFISSKCFKITGIDDRRYWNYIPTEESRFKSIAYLQQMWWVEVLGELEFEFPKGNYSLFFRLQLGKASKRLGRRVCNRDQVHGWDIKPVRFQLSTLDGQRSVSQCYLSGPGEWAHYHVGDFVIDRPNGPTNIKFSLAQIDCTHTKGGLGIDGAAICPTEFTERLKQSYS